MRHGSTIRSAGTPVGPTGWLHSCRTGGHAEPREQSTLLPFCQDYTSLRLRPRGGAGKKGPPCSKQWFKAYSGRQQNPFSARTAARANDRISRTTRTCGDVCSVRLRPSGSRRAGRTDFWLLGAQPEIPAAVAALSQGRQNWHGRQRSSSLFTSRRSWDSCYLS